MLGRLLSDNQITEMRDRIARQARYERERGVAGIDDAQSECGAWHKVRRLTAGFPRQFHPLYTPGLHSRTLDKGLEAADNRV